MLTADNGLQTKQNENGYMVLFTGLLFLKSESCFKPECLSALVEHQIPMQVIVIVNEKTV